MKIRISSTWSYTEIYDYAIEELPTDWDTLSMEQQAEWAYNNGEAYQVLTEPNQELHLDSVDVIN